MKLAELTKDVEIMGFNGPLDVDVKDLAYDSRKAGPGIAFVALTGFRVDGHDYINQAIEKGSKVIFVEKDVEVPEGITVVKLKNTRTDLSLLSRTLFNYPDQELTTIAVTGTKGKTSTTWMLKSCLEAAGKSCGIIGTTGVFYNDEYYPTNNTSPESYDVYKYMRSMVNKGVNYLAMEISSQSLKLNRWTNLMFDYSLFTNLSPDHIGPDEHESYEDYKECKSRLFKQTKHGFYNIDDKEYPYMSKDSSGDITTFGKNPKADFQLVKTEGVKTPDYMGVHFSVWHNNELTDYNLSVPGDFSAFNALGAISVLDKIGISKSCIQEGLEHVQVKGRMEQVKVSNDFDLIIDYAYQGVALESIIKTIKSNFPDARIVTIFGCGGNRSKQRRYDMGKISGEQADYSIITSDNPRYEEPMSIIDDILDSLRPTKGEYIVIPERKDAIRYALDNAKAGDVILLLGKGHEVYQEINGVKYPFDEREVIKEILKEQKRKILK